MTLLDYQLYYGVAIVWTVTPNQMSNRKFITSIERHLCMLFHIVSSKNNMMYYVLVSYDRVEKKKLRLLFPIFVCVA